MHSAIQQLRLYPMLLAVFLLTFVNISHAQSFTKEQILDRLKRFDHSSPLSAVIEMKTKNKVGSGDDIIASSSSIKVRVTHKDGQLSNQYSQGLLQTIKTEVKAHELDPNLPTPTQNAVSTLNIRRIQSMTNAHEVLIRRLNTATLIEQKTSDYKGAPATLMSFTVEPKLSKRDKKYIKKTQASMQLWVDKDGTPIACNTDFNMKGRAFLVITFKGEESKNIEYQVNGSRLLAVYQKSYNENSGAGEYGESTIITTLNVQ